MLDPEFLNQLLVTAFAAASILFGRIAFRLAADPVPPNTEPEKTAWGRKRKWAVWADIASLPGIATTAAAFSAIQDFDIELVFATGLAFAALGFPGVVALIERTWGPEKPKGDKDA